MIPPEFTQLGTRPSKWSPEDVVRVRTHGWVRNALSEVVRANVMAKSDADTDLLRANLEPYIKPYIAKEIDLKSIPLAVLDVYKLAIGGVTFGEDRLKSPLEKAAIWKKMTPLGEVIADTGMQGSNNWTIEGKRTSTGRPILANDPHRHTRCRPARMRSARCTEPGTTSYGASLISMSSFGGACI